MKHKITFHIKNDTWILIKFSNERKVITDRWIFKIKYELNENILKYKTRWIMHDYKQQFDVDFNNTWTEMMKLTFFKSLFILAEARDLYIYQMNVVIAFLYEILKEVIYVSQSNDFIEDSTLICELRKAFYDLKQSSRVWYNVIQKFLKSLNFIFTEADVSVFIYENKQTFICVYVDNVLLFKSDLNLLKLIKIKLSEHFKMIDLRFSNHYLNMKIIRFSNRINLN